MTRTELIQALADSAEMERKQAKMFLDALTGLVEKNIKRGGDVPLRGLGKFKVVKRKARMGRNPATGEAIKIPAKTVVRFTVAKQLKDLIKKK
ncbi:MAG TPA: HU family DNA-binding protein [Candidatus Polarisedimenticolaceae bacterium]|nr:HU family DNA-binding protein [Candidatus Polarisedimenticolaceae bacterium]